MVDGSIVLVAKSPIPGKSKTRLIPLLGPEGSASLALAMLSDTLQSLTTLKQSLSASARMQLILLYAPREEQGTIEQLLESLHISSHWELMSMITGDLKSSNLGAKLTDALQRVRIRQKHEGLEGPVVFLGMDSPETPLDEIAAIFGGDNDRSNNNNDQSTSFSLSSAILCPAEDGGYGMLSVPPNLASRRVFEGVRWSQSLTAVSQMKALTDAGIAVRIGRLMYDIDEPNDVHALVRRLQNQNVTGVATVANEKDVLLQSSAMPGHERTSDCPHTRNALCKLGVMPAARAEDAATHRK